MNKVVKQNNDSGLVTGIPVQRGKVISAIVLVSIMTILWLRVFLNSDNDEALATGPKTADVQNAQEEGNKLQYIDLPVISGRQDGLKRDVFAISDSSIQLETTEVEKPVEIEVPLKDGKEIVRKSVEGLTIDAIIAGSDDKESEAYVGNKVLKVGSIYTVEHGGESYRLEVKEIQESVIIFEWENNEFRAVMPGPDTAD